MMAALSNVELKNVVIVIVSLVIVPTALMNALDSFNSFRHRQQQLRQMLRSSVEHEESRLEKKRIQVSGKDGPTGHLSLKSEGRVIFLKDKYQMLERNRLMDKLHELSRLPIHEKRKTLVYIPKSIGLFWKSFGSCRTTPFIVPAITGMAMLDGLPDVNCKTRYYGYEVYKRSTGTFRVGAKQELICEKALAKGFSQVIVVDEDAEGNLVVSKLACSDS